MDLLKKIKGSIDAKETGVEITSVRPTRAGDLLIEVGADTGDATRLKMAIDKRFPEFEGVKKLSKKT